LWIEATGNYACIHTASGSHLLRETMAHLEEKLASHHFIRVRKSAIVNGGRCWNPSVGNWDVNSCVGWNANGEDDRSPPRSASSRIRTEKKRTVLFLDSSTTERKGVQSAL
jgi:hypothetical protein